MRKILLVVLCSIVLNSNAQIHCGLVEIVPNTTETAVATFDSFADYYGGIILLRAARIKIRVQNQVVVDPLCSWFLTMEVDNNPGAGTPANEWEQLGLYGAGGGINPFINSLEIRVRNACQTSPIDGTFQTFVNDGDILDIIAPLLPITPAGTCAIDVNGPGDYLTNYDEYHFDIDVRINPGFAYNPGIFNLNITFHLEENP